MTSDGGLRQIFQRHLPEVDWTSIETWSTGRGVPDLNYCFEGKEGWLELKQTSAWSVQVGPEQVGWIERRARAGGRVTIAVRRKTAAGPRKVVATDALYLLPARGLRTLAQKGLQDCSFLASWQGGPAAWDWADIKGLLCR